MLSITPHVYTELSLSITPQYIYTELPQVIIHTAVSTMLALIWSIQLVSGTICILLSLTVVPQSSNKNFKVRTIHAERESLDLQVGRMYQLYYCV